MPLFMDVHRDLCGLTASSFLAAHERALVADQAGVRWLHHWFDDRSGTAFCLVEAEDRGDVVRVHAAVNGLVPDEVVEVTEAPDPPEPGSTSVVQQSLAARDRGRLRAPSGPELAQDA